MSHHAIRRPVVVVADWREDNPDLNEGTDDLDLYTRDELDEILEALGVVCQNISVYPSPREFIAQISHHQGALVLPFWAGRISRNRTALVSAIAEASGLDFFGADTYAYIVAQDKALAKHLAREFGLRTPASILIRNLDQLDLIELVAAPVVVKPNLQGSSIGISQRSLCADSAQARALVMELLARFAQPVLVERFVEGREVTVTIWGRPDAIDLFQTVEIYEPAGQIDFTKTIWSYELKKSTHRPGKAQRAVSLDSSDELALRRLFTGMGKLELVRVDGRLTPDGFQFIEMNPEPYLGRIGSVAKAFALQGCDYQEMFGRLLLPFDVLPQGEAPVRQKRVVERQ